MAMYLANVLVYTTMLIGRWFLNAFLRYIRKQVQELINKITRKILIIPDFYTISDESASAEDPKDQE